MYLNKNIFVIVLDGNVRKCGNKYQIEIFEAVILSAREKISGLIKERRKVAPATQAPA